jgi:hypothetical protein
MYHAGIEGLLTEVDDGRRLNRSEQHQLGRSSRTKRAFRNYQSAQKSKTPSAEITETKIQRLKPIFRWLSGVIYISFTRLDSQLIPVLSSWTHK